MKAKKRVVIIGGGFAGSTIARKLQNNLNVTLIDTKEYFEFTPSILRVIVEPAHLKKIQVLHKSYLKKTQVVIGEVKSVTSSHVTVNNKKIPFDYLALCSGSSYASPIKESKKVIPLRARSLFTVSKKLEAAKSVLIVGGGLVGIELAAEIREKYPLKNITIVHASSVILERCHPKTQKYVMNYLSQNNILLRTNERVIKKQEKIYITNTGGKINADIAFFCTGIVPNIAFLKHNPLGKEILSENKVGVNPFLQLPNFPHIFSAGDVNDRAVEKTAQNAEKQAGIVAANILALENNRPLKAYQEKHTPIVISLGKRKGVFEAPPFVITGLLPGILKSIIEIKEMWKYR